MTLHRIRSTWSGLPGGSGVSTLYQVAAPSDADLTAIRTFWATCAGQLASDATIQVQNSGDIIDETTGALTGVWGPQTAVSSVVGTGGANYAAPSGGLVEWRTAGIVHGRRVRGRTFLVPVGSGVYDSDGTLLSTAVTAFQNAATALVVALTSMRVWSRPFRGSPSIPARSGSAHAVTSAIAKDKAVVLRSRRD